MAKFNIKSENPKNQVGEKGRGCQIEETGQNSQNGQVRQNG